MKLFIRVTFLFLMCMNIGIAQNTNDTIVAFRYYQKADSLVLHKKLDSANVYLEKTIPIYQKANVWERVAKSYNVISKNLWDLEDYDGSLMNAKKALEVCEKYLPPLTIEKAIASDRLGALSEYVELNYSKALDNYRKSLRMKKQLLGEDHLTIADSYSSLSSILKKTGKYRDALRYTNLNLSIKMRTLGRDHFKLCPALIELSVLYRHLGKYDLALLELEKGLVISKEKFGENHLETAKFYRAFSFVYLGMEEYPIAYHYLKKVGKDVIKEFEAPAHYYIHMGIVCQNLGRYNEALGYFKQATNTFGKNHEFLFMAYYGMSSIYILT